MARTEFPPWSQFHRSRALDLLLKFKKRARMRVSGRDFQLRHFLFLVSEDVKQRK